MKKIIITFWKNRNHFYLSYSISLLLTNNNVNIMASPLSNSEDLNVPFPTTSLPSHEQGTEYSSVYWEDQVVNTFKVYGNLSKTSTKGYGEYLGAMLQWETQLRHNEADFLDKSY